MVQHTAANTPPVRRRGLSRLPEVKRRTGLGTSSLYKLIREGRFPPPVRVLGARVSAWVDDEVDDWVADQKSRSARRPRPRRVHALVMRVRRGRPPPRKTPRARRAGTRIGLVIDAAPWQRGVDWLIPSCHGKSNWPMATARRTLAYAVTFEFTDRPPLTYRGIVAGARGDTCVSRAMRTAAAALHPVRWSSAVVVLTGVSQDRGGQQ